MVLTVNYHHKISQDRKEALIFWLEEGRMLDISLVDDQDILRYR